MRFVRGVATHHKRGKDWSCPLVCKNQLESYTQELDEPE